MRGPHRLVWWARDDVLKRGKYLAEHKAEAFEQVTKRGHGAVHTCLVIKMKMTFCSHEDQKTCDDSLRSRQSILW